jgi:glycosyltransferase involved in cell wall biosynthesis
MDAVVPVKVSVVIPHYNTLAFVRAAVESVLSQTTAAHEVIVIDDGSPDDPTEALAEINDPRLRLVRTPNGGAPHARNVGFDLTTGDVVAFLDADDVWYPSKLERQLPLFRNECSPVAVGAQMHHVGAVGESPIGITGEKELGDDGQRLVRAAELMPFPLSSALITRAAFQAVGGFDETVNLVEDLDLMSRLAAHGPIRTVGEPLGAYRMHSGQGSALQFRAQRQAARFVRARVAAREAGGDLAWSEFLAGRTGSRHEWLDDTARSLYRTAGVMAAERHYVGAALRLGASALMEPAYVIRRMRHQRVFALLRKGGRDRKAGQRVASFTPASRR